MAPPDPDPDPAALVELRSVSKRYARGPVALAGLDLTIRAGEFLSIIGPSGCGKSTLLRLIAGLGEPGGGTITRLLSDRRRLGFVFQEPTLMPWATVSDNVRLPLALAGGERAEAGRRVAEALERVGLAGFGQAFPRELSGGMRMRASIARALVTRPDLLLMDESFAAIDEITRYQLFDDLLDLWQGQGWTAVLVTHSLFDSVYLSSRVAVMTPRPGRLFAQVPIDAPYPRGEAFRTSPRFAHLCHQVAQTLTAAMGDRA